MNTSAAERLWKAIEELWNRIDKHCQKVKNSLFKFGACTVNPKRSGVGLPMPSIQLNQIKKCLSENPLPFFESFMDQYYAKRSQAHDL